MPAGRLMGYNAGVLVLSAAAAFAVGYWIFGAAALVALAVGFLATSYHSVRAASSDPVASLRYE